MDYRIKDPALAPAGGQRIDWAQSRMPVLNALMNEYAATRPLENLAIAGCLHVTAETAVLIKALSAAGAQLRWAGCNPNSTQDDIAASLVVNEKIPVFAWSGQTESEYYSCIDSVLSTPPRITVDDGADLVLRIHEQFPSYLTKVLGGTEETTTGVQRLRSMAGQARLEYPIIAVNDATTKHQFDNHYGTGQSTLDGIIRATNILLAGKDIVIAGYGDCGKGIAKSARGLGAHVTITEVAPMRALAAVMDGYRVQTMDNAVRNADVIITATGCVDVLKARHFERIKDGAILANAGHFNAEISNEALRALSQGVRTVRDGVEQYDLHNGKKVYLLGEGRLVNLVCAQGHPPDVMDMSFSNQFLSVLFIAQKTKERRFPNDVYRVPLEIDERIAAMKLSTMKVGIDSLDRKQRRYLSSYGNGT